MATNIQNNNYNYQYSNMPQRKGVKDFSLASLIGDEIPNIKEPEYQYNNNNNNNIINNNGTNNMLYFQNNLTALQNKFNSNNNINVNLDDYDNSNTINKKLLLISMILDKSFEIKDNNYLSILDKFCNINNNPLLPFSDGSYDYKKKVASNNILNNKDEIKNILNNKADFENVKRNSNVKVEERKAPMNNATEFNPKPEVKYSKLKRNRPTKFTIGNIPFKNDCYCSICNKVFNRKYDLRRHVRLHTNNTPYKCKACGQGFARSDYLKNHIRNTVSCLQSEHYKEKFSK